MRLLQAGLIAATVFAFTLQSPAPAQNTAPPEARVLADIRELSSDAYTGRAPGTDGETKTVAYLIARAKAIGLEPGNPDGSWTQTVQLWGMLSTGTITLSAYARGYGETMDLTPLKDYVAWTAMPVPATKIESSGVVFVGYGVYAPQFNRDDYAAVDVRGKTVFVLSGDPPVPESGDPHDPWRIERQKYLGRALSIYGRTSTKVETAYKRGAAAVILIGNGPLITPALFANYTREVMVLRGPAERQHVRAQALLSAERTAEFFRAAGIDFNKIREAAGKPSFHGQALPASASFDLTTHVRQVDSANVVAKITGSDPQLKNEYVFYSGHWDHHGQVGSLIYHGASDNAAGSAGVLELARMFHSLPHPPRRTIVFLWPTAEEKGLLGARWYVEHPLYPLAQTVADINLDYFSNWGWGRTRDFSIVGIGNSTLDDVTAAVVKQQGRVVTGDTAPEQGFYFRSDHYEFARVGVPSIETSPGIDYLGKPANFGVQTRAEYIAQDYHQPSDQIKPGWDLSGAIEDLQVLYEVGYRVAQADGRPTWKPDAIWRPKP